MKKLLLTVTIFLLGNTILLGQKNKKPSQVVKPAPVIFAVIDGGERIEPIGEIDKGDLIKTVGGDSDAKDLTQFAGRYYKPKTTYNLIFGGAKNGTVTVVNSNTKSDCGKNAATVTTTSSKAKLKGIVMALATNDTPYEKASGVRRLPTAQERSQLETLVRAEFTKQKISANAIKAMKYHNLTAVDIDNDKTPEFVGSYYTANSANERNLLFFIAEKGKSGKYEIAYSNFETIKKDSVMSGELKDLDESGMLNELLLDVFEYNGGTRAEIFTVKKAFEGYNYYVYSKLDGKWQRVFDGYNYHCAY